MCTDRVLSAYLSPISHLSGRARCCTGRFSTVHYFRKRTIEQFYTKRRRVGIGDGVGHVLALDVPVMQRTEFPPLQSRVRQAPKSAPKSDKILRLKERAVDGGLKMRSRNNHRWFGAAGSSFAWPYRHKCPYNILPLSINHCGARFFSFRAKWLESCGGCADAPLLRLASGAFRW
jgi:hypothetical protein